MALLRVGPGGTRCPDRLEPLMTSSGKVRIYELSRDLGLESRDVLDAAEKLAIAARSHSSSISDDEAVRIRDLIRGGASTAKANSASGEHPQAILSLKKAASAATATGGPSAKAPAAPASAPATAVPPVSKPKPPTAIAPPSSPSPG
ncbi:MAG: translation initiation factor IF-2 N-terminal domain-containing protein, partial [Synechococcaceae cyanobacterium ELA445]